MFNKENIHPKVQRALYRKIDAMNRLTLTDNRVTTVTGEDGKEFVSGTIPNSNPFFIGNSLEPQDSSNPIEQHLYRGTFAKVSVAVPEFNSDESDIIRKPISISSYLTNEINEDNEIERINTPLTFRDGIGERVFKKDTGKPGKNVDNLFLGHSGITSIKVDQQNFYTYKYTIGWVCPDPVYFEEVFEPSFLKFGAYVAMEFGWGINDSNFDTPSLSIEEMERLLQEEGRLLKRNQDSAGNYHCGVGTVIMFNWKIMENGTYAGDIQVMTPGANTLLETTQGTSESSNAIPVRKLNNTLEIKRLAKEILVDLADKNQADRNKFLTDSGVSEQQLINALQDTNETSNKLEENSIVFGLVMKNLSSVCDKYLEVIEPTGDFGFLGAGLENIQESFAQRNTGVETNDNFKDDSNAYSDRFSASLRYAYRDGLMRIDVNPSKLKNSNQNAGTSKDIPDFLKERHFATWGWFEDNILKSFFELTTGGGTKLQEIKSVTAKNPPTSATGTTTSGAYSGTGVDGTGVDYTPNACVSTQYLYSLGLDHTILPGKHHPILELGFDVVKEEERFLIPELYSNEQRIELDRIRLVYTAIDKVFKPFESTAAKMKDDDKATKDVDESLDVKTPGIGSIRNMVFPIEKFITHFENTPSLRQGLRNFWADVTNQYGGYWGFEIGQDVNQPTRVGVFDSYYSEDSITDKTSSPDDPKGRFKFSVLSDTSIVKSFDVDLQLTGEAATLARYGGFSKANRGTSRIDGKKDLGLEAWNILTSKKSHEDVLTLDQLERFKKIQPDVVKDLNYSSRTIDFKSIPTIKEDSQKILEKVENERTQFLSGVGCYDKRGNFSQYFKQTMLYLINYSDLKGTGSNLEKLQVPLPVEVSLTLDGIGGLKVGDLFSIDYLPQLYRKHCYFMISNIGHSVSTSGWETTITGKMIADMPDFYKRSGKKLGAGLEDYEELFRVTEVGELDLANLNAFQTAMKELDELESRKAYEKVRDNIDKLTDTQLRTVLSRFELTINYNQVKRLRPQLIKKWETYLQVLEILGNTEQTTKENVRYTTFLDKLDLFLERNEEYEKTAVRRRIEDSPVAKAIFEGIKFRFKNRPK